MRRRLLASLAAVSLGACGEADESCDRAVRASAWAEVAARCPAGSPEAELGLAWQAFAARDVDGVLRRIEALRGTAVDADANFLGGYVLGAVLEDRRRARGYLERAVDGFRAAGRHGDAARAAVALSRAPGLEHPWDDALAAARLAVDEAERAGGALVLGKAYQALGEVYDDLGLIGDARKAFVAAVRHQAGLPRELAFTYLKHAQLLLSDQRPGALRTSLSYFDAARETIEGATEVTDPVRVELVEATETNRVAALVDLGELDAARRAIDQLATDASWTHLVRVYLEARAGDLVAAERAFAAAGFALDGDLSELDVAERQYWFYATHALAQAYRGAGQRASAERYLRAAVAAIEHQRAGAAAPELRASVLARSAAAYHDLIAVLAEAGRARDALVIAESLHARTWLDVAVGPAPTDRPALDATLARGRLWSLQPPRAPLDAAAVEARLAGREVLAFVATPDRVWRFHAVDGQVAVVALDAQAWSAIEAFTGAPEAPDRAAAAATALLPPGVFSRTAPLYLIPGSRLAAVPFAALLVDGAPLIERRPIAYLPGLAALGCAPGPWTEQRVHLGDAAGDLPHARREVESIAGASARVGRSADRAALVAARRARLLHVAVHGRRSAGGYALGLADGPFSVSDALVERLAPQTAFLTGCGTATADDPEGWAGFPSVLLANGARHVIATSRSVDDAAAAALMRAYFATPDGLAPAERLQQVQRESRDHLPVSTWAAFTAWGDAACPADLDR